MLIEFPSVCPAWIDSFVFNAFLSMFVRVLKCF
jgi:hypothetical protein